MQEDLDIIISKFDMVKFTNELDALLSSDTIILDKELKEHRIKCLEYIITHNKKEDVTTKKENYLNQINHMVYRNPWNRLQHFHKIKKIEEYVEEKFKDKKYKENLLMDLTNLVNSNKISTKRHVDYDYNAEKIINIHVLKINDKEDSYNIVHIK